ncbi:4Fe-4S binding protein [Candidatus Sumerlaeota bacterium]|nr:4Fe-4S binding protein [Candidatus Sumerlaeota bacterium]
MFEILKARFQQGHQTTAYPAGPPPQLSERFAGMPAIERSACHSCDGICAGLCPSRAIQRDAAGAVALDMGRCLFCNECAEACPKDAIRFTSQYQLAAAKREDLITDGVNADARLALNERAARLYGRSFALRVVSAGGCGACEADVNVLTTLTWDIGRFGLHYAASPRHADGLLLIGPVPENMAFAVKETYDAIPAPKFVIAVGACAISGGMYADHPECHAGRRPIIPIDLHIPGCPPHPLTILDGLLRFLGRISEE